MCGADMKVSDVMLPVGQTEDKLDRLRVVKLEKTQELMHSIAAVAHPKRSQDRDASSTDYSWMLSSPAAGFVFVYVAMLCGVFRNHTGVVLLFTLTILFVCI